MRTWILTFLASVALLFGAVPVLAQEDEPLAPIEYKNTYSRGEITSILVDDILDIGGFRQPYQKAEVRIVDGPDAGYIFTHDFQLPVNHKEREKLREGEQVVVVKVMRGDEAEFYIAEKYRLPSVLLLFAGFTLLILLTAGWKGISSLVGLSFSLLVIVEFMIPKIVAGWSPVWVSLLSGFAILFVSLYMAHGFKKRTTIALVGTLITLVFSAVASIAIASFTKLFGMGSDESISLLQGQLQGLNLRGLYLAGIIIGALGVLDDITTAQAATVDEIHRANPALSISELYKRGLSVGHEHIASLVNTLALAYVGASLPILLIFTKTDFPLWVIFNSEFLVEEIVRTLVGSAALILAVPITTYIAAQVFGRDTNPAPIDHDDHGHSHAGHHH